MIDRRRLLKTALATPLLGSGIVAIGQSTAVAQEGAPVRVGSKDFTEQFILGHMYLQVLENAGIPTSEHLNLGGTQIAHQALVSGDIDLYPEYTGTGLLEVLKMSLSDVGSSSATPVASPTAGGATPESGSDIEAGVLNLVRSEYEQQFQLTWLEQSPANNTQALAVKRTFSEENGITTISQLAEQAGDYTISAPADFPEREDGLLGLERVYGDNFAQMEILPVTPGLKYQALLDDEAQVVLAFGTDGQISGHDLVILEDDLGLWPPYHVAPVIRQETLDVYPDIPDVLNPLTASLTDSVLSSLNWKVDGDEKMEPEDVAREYLEENGFLNG